MEQARIFQKIFLSLIAFVIVGWSPHTSAQGAAAALAGGIYGLSRFNGAMYTGVNGMSGAPYVTYLPTGGGIGFGAAAANPYLTGMGSFGQYWPGCPYPYMNSCGIMCGMNPYAYMNQYMMNPGGACTPECYSWDRTRHRGSYGGGGGGRHSGGGGGVIERPSEPAPPPPPPKTEPGKFPAPDQKPPQHPDPTLTDGPDLQDPSQANPPPVGPIVVPGPPVPPKKPVEPPKPDQPLPKPPAGECVGDEKFITDANFCPTCGDQKATEPVKEKNVSDLRDVSDAALSELPSGAKTIMKAMYQDCSVVQKFLCANIQLPGLEYNETKKDSRKINNWALFLSGHPYYSKICNPDGSMKNPPHDSACRDINVCNNPAFFNYGGKAKIRDGEIDLFNEARTGKNIATDKNGNILRDQNGKPLKANTGLDCSGFVTASMAAVGARVFPGKSDWTISATSLASLDANGKVEVTTTGTDGKSKLEHKATCFRPAEYKGNLSLQPGDIISVREHTFMIESVGNSGDPYNVGSWENCRLDNPNFDPKKFDFTLFQSTSQFGSIGVGRSRAKEYFSSTNFPWGQFRQEAQKACCQKFKDRKECAGVSTIAGDSLGASHDYNKGITIIRHKPEIPGCKGPALPVKGAKCAELNCQAGGHK